MTDTVLIVEKAIETVTISAPAETVTIPVERVTVITAGIQGPEGVQGPEGPEGPQGEPGALGSDAYYVHNQNVPATDWTVNHNLNKYPAVQVIDSGGTVVIGQIDHISVNQLIVRFSVVFGGQAICN